MTTFLEALKGLVDVKIHMPITMPITINLFGKQELHNHHPLTQRPTMALLTREHIQNIPTTFDKVEVDVTEWGNINPATGERERTTVFVREMSAKEFSKFQMAGITVKNRKVRSEDGMDVDAAVTLRERMIVATCCDADGNLIFKPEDVEFLRDKPVKVLERLAEAAVKINKLDKKDLADEEETVKN